MNNDLVTVYITNHNYGRYLEQSIRSVLDQSYKNIELIIIDDGSSDESRDLLKNYESNRKIKIIYQNNRGLTISNNIALQQAQGYYIIRLDADDYLDKNAVKILVNEFDDEKIGMVFGDWYVINDIGEVLSIEKRHDFQDNVKMYDRPAHGACTMFRVDYIRNIGGYNESLLSQDGYELWFRFIEEYKVKNINIPIFFYRKHGNSLTDNHDNVLKTRSLILDKLSKRHKQKNPSTVAIFPVRGEKLDYRSKPFKKIKGRNLIDWSLDSFLGSKGIDKIVVSSPDKKTIQYILNNYDNDRIIPVERPVDLSYIGVQLIKTIEYINEKLDIVNNYDAFILHSIETPFIKKHLIESAINTYKIFQTDTVIGVREDNRYYYKHNGSGLVPINYSEGIIKYEAEKWYTDVSGFLLRDIKSFFKTKKMMGEKIGHVLFDKIASMVIEDELDLKVANLYIDQ